MTYVGRFAPSPTGPLHYGSLVAALASFLDARHAGGKWLLRIDDLDPPRESIDAPQEILRQLLALGLQWDLEVLYQSARLNSYDVALESIQPFTFPCTCSRKSVPNVYPGTCRLKRIIRSLANRMQFDSKYPSKAYQSMTEALVYTLGIWKRKLATSSLSARMDFTHTSWRLSLMTSTTPSPILSEGMTSLIRHHANSRFTKG